MDDEARRPFIEWKNLRSPANLLSISRVVLLAPIVYFLLQPGEAARWWALFWIALAVTTDYLDGRVARAREEVTEEGKILDPLADKICVGVVVVVLALTGEIPLWFFAVIVSRDILIAAAALYLKGRFGEVISSNMVGKVAVTVIVAALALMVVPFEVPAALIAVMQGASVVMVVASLLFYAREFLHRVRGAG